MRLVHHDPREVDLLQGREQGLALDYLCHATKRGTDSMLNPCRLLPSFNHSLNLINKRRPIRPVDNPTPSPNQYLLRRDEQQPQPAARRPPHALHHRRPLLPALAPRQHGGLARGHALHLPHLVAYEGDEGRDDEGEAGVVEQGRELVDLWGWGKGGGGVCVQWIADLSTLHYTHAL